MKSQRNRASPWKLRTRKAVDVIMRSLPLRLVALQLLDAELRKTGKDLDEPATYSYANREVKEALRREALKLSPLPKRPTYVNTDTTDSYPSSSEALVLSEAPIPQRRASGQRPELSPARSSEALVLSEATIPQRRASRQRPKLSPARNAIAPSRREEKSSGGENSEGDRESSDSDPFVPVALGLGFREGSTPRLR